MEKVNPKTPVIYNRGYAGAEIALCQIATTPWDVAGNLESTLGAIEIAAEGGADLAITPECVLTGYGIEHDRKRQLKLLSKFAEPVDGPSITRLRNAARKADMHVVVGFAERDTQGVYYNSAALINRDGEIIALYRKVHCRDFERADARGAFRPGERFKVEPIRCRKVRIALGIMICFDRELPESVRCLRALGAQLIACPLACDTSRLTAPGNFADNEIVTRCRAAENEVFIAVVNHAKRFNGGSFIVGPGGESVCQLGRKPKVKVTNLPIEAIRSCHHKYPRGWMGWAYRRPEVYRKVPGFV